MPPTPFSVPRRWSVAEPTFAAEDLSRVLGLPLLLARCLVNRGVGAPAAAELFLAPRLKNLADPFLLPQMGEAIDALMAARRAGEQVVIFGDYDVDGVTATAILLETLEFFGWKASAFLPHRLEDGYGLNLEAAERAVRQTGARLLLAVDCGSTSFDSVSALNAAGITVIILDHHQVASPPPPAAALVNPQRGSRFRELCSAGLAFKLAHALTKRLREENCPEAERFDVRAFLDLVALGTVADLVPLTDENRTVVTAGLLRLEAAIRPGLIALKSVSQIKDRCGVYEIGFQLGPRLNAAGRLEHAAAALDLLRETDPDRSRSLSISLDSQNTARRALEQKIADECLAALRTRFNPAEDFVIVEGNADWHPGVVGIVASRVQREFHRPTIIVGSDGVTWRGSGRSIEGFDLAAGLRQCEHLLETHGGHAMAAGLSLLPANLPLLRARLNEFARASLNPQLLQRTIRLDAEATLADLTLADVTALDRLAPFGIGNPHVQVVVRKVRLHGAIRRMGAEQKHARFLVTDGGDPHQVVWWNCGALPDGLFDLAVVPELNTYNGSTRVQLKLVDVRPSAS